jgi:alpha-L-fucosidase
MGAWLAVNGESIYGTQASPLGKMPWGRITTRPLGNNRSRSYLHLWEVTPGTALFIKGIQGSLLAAKVLESGQPVQVELGRTGCWIQLPGELKGIDLPVIALDVQVKRE